jgi:hypothetical protein
MSFTYDQLKLCFGPYSGLKLRGGAALFLSPGQFDGGIGVWDYVAE